MNVGIVDYGVGNLASVRRALEEVGASASIITDPMRVPDFRGIVLPGVGNFAECARTLEAEGWSGALLEPVRARERALLGICLGMQLLADSSTEGVPDGQPPTRGLGLIAGRIKHLGALGCQLRIPHVGWNELVSVVDDPLLEGVTDGTDVYFVHSYAFQPNCRTAVIASAHYGVTFSAAVRQGKVWGTQFHPEKSSSAGLRILANFVRAIC